MSEWISVEDRFPRLELQVIVGNKYDVGTDFRVRDFNYNGDEKFGWFKHGQDGWVCTHWMPLPEPPKKEQTE